MKNHLGNPLGVAKVRVNETYKGIVPNNIYVVTNIQKNIQCLLDLKKIIILRLIRHKSASRRKKKPLFVSKYY